MTELERPRGSAAFLFQLSGLWLGFSDYRKGAEVAKGRKGDLNGSL